MMTGSASRIVMVLIVAFALTACASAPPEPSSVALRESTTTRTPQPSATPPATATPRSTQTATSQPTATATLTATAELTATVDAVSADAALLRETLADDMLRALNERRSAERCPELALEPRLMTAAQAHAAEITRRREVSHRSADGATLEQRLERVGYPFQRRSETIAVSLDPSALAVVDRWLDEPIDGPHRSSVMNCVYQDVGVGVDWTPQGVIYWVVDFGQPRP